MHNGHWLHECITWNGADGRVTFIVNGVSTGVSILYPGYILSGEAAIVVGQRQSTFGRPFETWGSFTGELSQLNMWDYVLEPSAVSQMIPDMWRPSPVGNFLTWPDLRLHIVGNVQVKPIDRPAAAGNATVIFRSRVRDKSISLFATRIYVIGFFDLIDFWVIKIKKPMILCARSTSRSREQYHAARTCKRFVYSVVKITRLYDCQTWPTHFLEKFTRCAKVCGSFFS